MNLPVDAREQGTSGSPERVLGTGDDRGSPGSRIWTGEPAPQPLVVIGGGGHGRETVSLFRDFERTNSGRWVLLGVLADSEPDRALLARLETTWLGPIDEIKGLDCVASVAIGDGSVRAQIHADVEAYGRRLVTLVHPSASLGTDILMGDGCYVGAGTVATTNVRLGRGVQVNIACNLSHDVAIGDFATLAPGVNLAGGVTIEPRATVFTGASIVPGVRVGAASIVGAGAVVTADVAPGETVVGVPAKPLRKAWEASAPRP